MTPSTRTPLRALPVAIALVFNMIIGPLAPILPGMASLVRADDVVVTQDTTINGCNGVVSTPGSENTDKRLIAGSLEPGGTATFEISYPVDPEDVAGREEFEITDCVFIDDVAVAKYFVHFVPNTENYILTFTLEIPADAPVGDEYCNYAKTTAAPSESQASNRKAGPACFLIGGDLLIHKTDAAGAPLAGATFSIACTWPTSTASLANTVISAQPDGSVSDGNDANSTNDPSESFTSTSGGTLNKSATTGSDGTVAVAAPVGTSCLFTETSPPAGYLADPNDLSETLVVTSGEQQTHTFVNTVPPGKLEVVKDLSPSDDPGLFNLQIDGTTEAANVGDGGSTGEQVVTAGGHTVGETAGTGTSLSDYSSSISCRADDGAGAVVASSSTAGPLSVPVASNADIVCTITNTRLTGTLEVVKDLSPSDDPGLFNLQIDGTTEAANVGDGGTTGEQTLNTGTHTVGETAGTGTSLSDYTSSISCRDGDGEGAVVASGATSGPLNVSVTSGADIVCVISNGRQTGALEVVKDLNPSDDPGLFNLQIDGTTEAANVGDGGTTGEQTLNTGTHTVGETAGTGTSLANYDASIECRADNGAGAVVASSTNAGPLNVSVTNGADIVCTITNTRQTGALEVVKDLNPSDDPGLFNLKIDSTVLAANVGDGGSTGEQTLNTGIYSVSETAGTGTSLADYASSIVCKADDGAGATVASGSGSGPLNVTVTDGADIVCTITNTRDTGTLEVVKDLNPSDDPGLFDLLINGGIEADDVSDGGTTGAVTLNTGIHTVGEAAGTGTSLGDYTSSISCRDGGGEGGVVASGSGTGPLNVTIGDNDDIVCVITNTRQTGTIEVVKDLNPSDDPGRFDLQVDGATEAANVGDGGSTGDVTLNTGTHTVGEIAAEGTSMGNYASSIECRSDGGEGAVVASGAGSGPLNVNVTNEADIRCVITNTRVTVGFSKSDDQGEDRNVEPGETIHYTLTVIVNNGDATGVVVTDTIPAGLTYVEGSADPAAGFDIDGQDLTWTVGTLAQGTHTFEYDATVDADASGSLTNLGCVDADQNDALVCDETTVNVQRIAVEKTNGTEGPVLPGTVVDFTLTLDVTFGPIDGVTIVDQLPDGIGNATGISDGGVYDPEANTITWELTDVADGETLTYRAAVSATATAGGYTNVATITEGPCVEDCDDDSTVTVRVPSLLIDKAASTETVLLLFDPQGNLKSATPSTVTWTLTWTLTSGPVTNATITDVIPDGLTYVAGSATSGGSYDATTRTLTWTFATLNTGSGSVTFQTTTDADAVIGTPIENVSVIDSSETAPDEGRDSITVTEQQEQGSTGTPAPSLGDTASVSGPNGQPVTIPVELLAVLFLASLGTLATVNVRSVRRRR